MNIEMKALVVLDDRVDRSLVETLLTSGPQLDVADASKSLDMFAANGDFLHDQIWNNFDADRQLYPDPMNP